MEHEVIKKGYSEIVRAALLVVGGFGVYVYLVLSLRVAITAKRCP